MAPDEREFLQRVQREGFAAFGNSGIGKVPRDIAREMGMNPKRAAYLCDKWDRKGWYEYGVNVMCGWLTDTGIAVAL
jgi:hypothetical protein